MGSNQLALTSGLVELSIDWPTKPTTLLAPATTHSVSWPSTPPATPSTPSASRFGTAVATEHTWWMMGASGQVSSGGSASVWARAGAADASPAPTSSTNTTATTAP